MALVLLNPHARSGRARALADALQRELSRLDASARLEMPANVSDAHALIAQQPRGARIVVVGGDGTLHQLLPALLAGGHETALVPAGSGDDSARALGLRGLALPQALAHALTAPSHAVDVGQVQTEHAQRPFFSSLCAGFDAAVAQRALNGPRWLGGRLRYLLATLRQVSSLRLYDIRITVDGLAPYSGSALFVSTLNTPSYGGGLPAVPTARIDDGRLNLLLAGRFGRAATLAMLPRLMAGRHLGHAQVRCLPFSRLHIEAAAALPLAADGEAMLDARHIELRVLPAALRVVTRDITHLSAPGRNRER